MESAPNCIFCQIVAGQIPAERVYEDENFLAFLSIDPRSPGHTLIIPKTHYRWVWDYPAIEDYFGLAKKIALAQRQAFKLEAIWSQVVGEEVAHAHIWVFPHPKLVEGDKTDLKTNAAKIRAALENK